MRLAREEVRACAPIADRRAFLGSAERHGCGRYADHGAAEAGMERTGASGLCHRPYGSGVRPWGDGYIEAPRFAENFLANHVTRIPQNRKFSRHDPTVTAFVRGATTELRPPF